MRSPRALLLIPLIAAALLWLWWPPSNPSDQLGNNHPATSAHGIDEIAPGDQAPVELVDSQTDRSRTGDKFLLRVVDEDGNTPSSADFYWREQGQTHLVTGDPSSAQIPRQGEGIECTVFADGRWSDVYNLSAEERQLGYELLLTTHAEGASVKLLLLAPNRQTPSWSCQASWSKSIEDEIWASVSRGYLVSQTSTSQRDSDSTEINFDNLPPGIWSFEVEADGYPPQVLSASLTPGDSIELTVVLEAGAFVRGRVLDADGNPLEHAEALLVPESSSALLQIIPVNKMESVAQAGSHSFSDDSGMLRLGPVAAGNYIAFVKHSGFQAWQSSPFPLASGGRHQLGEIRLEPGTDLSVLVLDQKSGEAIEGAEVEWFAGSDFQQSVLSKMAPWNDAVAATDADGRTTLDQLPDGKLSVRAVHRGYAWEDILVSAYDREFGEVVLRLSPAIELRGRVLRRHDGQAVADAVIKAYPPSQDLLAGFTAGIGDSPSEPQTRSNEYGEFTLSDLKPGDWRVSAVAAGWAPGIVEIVIIEGIAPEELEILLHVGASLLVKVLDENGDDEPEALVTAFNFAMMGGGSPESGLTDERGEIRFENLLPGKYQVQAFAAGMEMQLLGATLGDLSGLQTRSDYVDIGEEGEFQLVLGGIVAHSDIEGFVWRGDEAMANQTVMLNSANGIHTTTTDEIGYYEFSRIAAGDYLMMVGSFGIGSGSGWYSSLHVEGGELIEKNVELPSTSVKVMVSSAVDGRPLGQIPVLLRAADGTPGGGYKTTEPDGSVHFDYPNPGEYVLSVGFASMPLFGGGREFETKILEGIFVAENQDLSLEVRLHPSAELVARVIDTFGNPVAGAGVFVISPSGQPLTQFSMSTTDNEGRIRMVALPAGRMQILARHPSLGEGTLQIELSAGANREVDIMLEAGCLVRVLVTDENGEPQPGVFAVARNRHGAPISMLLYGNQMIEYSINIMSGGEQKLGPLAPGDYTLLLSSLSGENMQQPLSIESGVAEMRLEIVFAP